MKFADFEDVNKWLVQFVPESVESAYTLERMVAFMELLGNPQDSYKTVHIAGTSGKTSTAYYISKLIELSGQKVGLSVSPHLDEINERAQINTLPLNESRYCELMSEFASIEGLTQLKPTYFELLVAFAYWTFAKEKVDYAVIEVGLGGLLDGTNIISSRDKVCVITDIGLDHTHILGDTLEKISQQKAGIIKPNNEVFMMKQADEVVEIFKGQASQNKAELAVVDDVLPETNKLPVFQKRNWSLAKHVFDFIQKRDGLKSLSNQQILQSLDFQVPGRMEIIERQGKTIILDGAHNSDKFKMLETSMKKYIGNQKPIFVIGLLLSKQAHLRAAAKMISHNRGAVIVTHSEAEQDTRHQWVDSTDFIKVLKGAGIKDIDAVPDAEEAVQQAINSEYKIIIITGSLYLLSEVRQVLFK